MNWEKANHRNGFVFSGDISPENPIDLREIVVGKSKVVLKAPDGCCGTTLCMKEYTVEGVGKYKDAGLKQIIPVFRLESGVFCTPNQISYVLNPE